MVGGLCIIGSGPVPLTAVDLRPRHPAALADE
jgi:hypothetical protein